MLKGLEKYLREAEQQRTLESNYFDDSTSCMNAEPILEDAEQTTQPSKGNPSVAKQKSIEDTDVTRNALESLKLDTGQTSRQHSQVCTDADEQCQQIMTLEDIAQDTDTQHCDRKHPVEDFSRKPTLIHSEQPNAMPTCTDEIIMSTKKVGCMLVTSHFKQFLEGYPPSSDKQAFLDIYHMLSLLDKYLYDNPKQHTHCMSSDNEYVTLLKYAI